MSASPNGRPLVVERALIVAAGHRSAGRGDAAALLYEQVLGAEPDNAEARAALAELRPARERAVARSSLGRRLSNRVALPAVEALAQRPRIWKYRALSSCTRVSGRPVVLQPVLFVGLGTIALGEHVQFGWNSSPHFYTGYCYLEAGQPVATIELGDRCEFNNNLMLKSEGPGIRIGANALFGANVEVFDSDFHELQPHRRHGHSPRMAAVEIGENVFVGMGVKILKGVTIGADAVIGAGSIVTSSIPAGVIAVGSPARVVREL